MLQFTPLRERNVLVAPHDRSQDASRIRTEMANLALISLVTPCPCTANGPATPALSARGSHSVPMVGALIFQGPKDLFTDPEINTRPFSVLWPHSHDIANHLPIDHPSLHYSCSSTLNLGILNGCVMENVSQLW